MRGDTRRPCRARASSCCSTPPFSSPSAAHGPGGPPWPRSRAASASGASTSHSRDHGRPTTSSPSPREAAAGPRTGPGRGRRLGPRSGGSRPQQGRGDRGRRRARAGERRSRLPQAVRHPLGRRPRHADGAAAATVSGLYAFALLSGRPRGPLGRGFGRESLRLVRCAGLLVTVSRLPATPATSLSALRRHDAVVRRLVRRADGVLPFRFGTFVDDRPTLARRLSARAPALRRALSLVAGREQMTLRVYGP